MLKSIILRCLWAIVTRHGARNTTMVCNDDGSLSVDVSGGKYRITHTGTHIVFSGPSSYWAGDAR